MAAKEGHERVSRHRIGVVAPFRLDLTVNALRRLPTNVVDVLTGDGHYHRALAGRYGRVVVRARQAGPETLALTLEGAASAHAWALETVRRILGVKRDLTAFERAAARVPWLRPLAERMRGLKPPRYPTLWEASVNAIVFQQVSLQAASTIVRRMVVALSPSLESDGVVLYPFPEAEHFASAEDGMLREAGLSASKLATLRRTAEALASGTLGEAALEERASPVAAKLLQRIKGIGPWTATVILLRGLGRLDVFPMNDSSVARNLELITGQEEPDAAGVLEALGSERGMLYYHLLLARLEAKGEVGRATRPAK